MSSAKAKQRTLDMAIWQLPHHQRRAAVRQEAATGISPNEIGISPNQIPCTDRQRNPANANPPYLSFRPPVGICPFRTLHNPLFSDFMQLTRF
jgi:hypothetical protein